MSSSDEKPQIILTCEHAGNDVPQTFKHLFDDEPNVLNTHEGYDIGALELARYLSDQLKTDVYYTTITRLLVEANRSVNSKDLFSRFSTLLTKDEKEQVLDTHYYPYRKKVEDAIVSALQTTRVIHLSIHTFTPVLNGERRKADIGVLYDPDRSFEKLTAQRLISELNELTASLSVLPNSPYKGTDDGFTTYLRTTTDPKRYAGIEIEVNQKFFTDHEELLDTVKAILVASIRRTSFTA